MRLVRHGLANPNRGRSSCSKGRVVHVLRAVNITPRGRAKPPLGRLHEISALFGLETSLNYTL
jgi:hypothetical protein